MSIWSYLAKTIRQWKYWHPNAHQKIRALPVPRIDLAEYLVALLYCPGVFSSTAIIRIIRCTDRCELKYEVNSLEGYANLAIAHAYLSIFFFILPLIVFIFFNRYIKYQLAKAPYINTGIIYSIGTLLFNAAICLNLAVCTEDQPDAHPIDTNKDEYYMLTEECEQQHITHELFGYPETYAPGVYNNSQTPNADAFNTPTNANTPEQQTTKFDLPETQNPDLTSQNNITTTTTNNPDTTTQQSPTVDSPEIQVSDTTADTTPATPQVNTPVNTTQEQTMSGSLETQAPNNITNNPATTPHLDTPITTAQEQTMSGSLETQAPNNITNNPATTPHLDTPINNIQEQTGPNLLETQTPNTPLDAPTILTQNDALLSQPATPELVTHTPVDSLAEASSTTLNDLLNNPAFVEYALKKYEYMETILNTKRIFEYDQPSRADFYSVPLGASGIEYHWFLIATCSVLIATSLMIGALIYYLSKICRDKTIYVYLKRSPLLLPLTIASLIILMLTYDWLSFFFTFLKCWFFNIPLPTECSNFFEILMAQLKPIATFPGLFIFLLPAVGFMSYLLEFITTHPVKHRNKIANTTIAIGLCCFIGWLFYSPTATITYTFYVYTTSGILTILLITHIIYIWGLNLHKGIKPRTIEIHIFGIMFVFLTVGLIALGYRLITAATFDLQDTLFPSGLLHIFGAGFAIMLFLGWLYQKFSNLHHAHYSFPLALIQLYTAFVGILCISITHLIAGFNNVTRNALLELFVYKTYYALLYAGLVLLLFSHIMIIIIILYARYKKKDPIYFRNPDNDRTHFFIMRAHILEKTTPTHHRQKTKKMSKKKNATSK